MSLCNFCTLGEDSDSSLLSNGLVVLVGACGITFFVTLIFTAVITFGVTYLCCVKRKLTSTDKQPAAVLANTAVDPSSLANVEMQPNPAYSGMVDPFLNQTGLEIQPNTADDTSHRMIMGTIPVYESIK